MSIRARGRHRVGNALAMRAKATPYIEQVDEDCGLAAAAPRQCDGIGRFEPPNEEYEVLKFQLSFWKACEIRLEHLA
jgi:hypothetical protein